MPFNAVDFRTHFAKVGGFAHTNHFEVILSLPPIMNGQWQETYPSTLQLRAHVVDMPSRTLETLERRYAGPMRNVPIGHTYTTLQLEFLEAGDRKSRKFFDQWQELITSANDGWSVPYYKDLVADKIELRLFNKYASSPAAVYTFHECFPITIGASNLSWGSHNQIMTIPIEIAFHRWENEMLTPKKYLLFDKSTFPVGSGGFFETLKKIHKQYKAVVKTVNQVKSTVKYYKNLGKEIKTFVKQVKNIKPNFSSLDKAAESLSKIDRTFESGVQVVNRDKFPTYEPLFKSQRQSIKIPAIFVSR